jgi:hypothetical protein
VPRGVGHLCGVAKPQVKSCVLVVFLKRDSICWLAQSSFILCVDLVNLVHIDSSPILVDLSPT